MSYKNFEDLYTKVKANPDIHIIAAGPAKREVLRTLKKIQEKDMAQLVFVGDTAWVFHTSEHEDVDMTKVKMIHEKDLRFPAAFLALQNAMEGKGEVVMNGYVKSEYMIQAALDRNLNFTKGGVLSQLTAVEIHDAQKLLFITDTGINVKPNPAEKMRILENAFEYLKRLGMEEIKVAVLEGNTIISATPEDEATIKAEQEERNMLLEKLKLKYPKLTLSEPITLNESMKQTPDLILCSSAEAGQVLAKALQAFMGGKSARIILGGAVPMVLTANNLTEEHLWNSLIMAMAGV